MAHRLGSRETRVEIDHPDVSEPITPRLLDDPQYKPTLNGTPTVEIPVPKNDKWLSSAFEDAPVRVWLDGQRLPIDQLLAVRPGTDQTTLVGGVELNTRIETGVQEQEAYKTAQDVIDQTPYAADVDAPSATTRTRTLQDVSTAAEFQANLQTIPDDKPLSIVSGQFSDELQSEQVAFLGEAEAFGNGGSVISDSNASGGEARLYALDGDSYNFDLNYTIPGENVVPAIRCRVPSGSTQAEFSFLIDGVAVETIPADTLESADTYSWTPSFQYSGSDLAPGLHSVGVELGTSGEDLIVDQAYLYDDRYASTPSSTSPALWPDRVEVETVDSATIGSVTGGSMAALMTGGLDTVHTVGVSNDQGATFASGSATPRTDTEVSISTDFSSPSPQIRGRIGFDGPGQGAVSSFQLEADVDQTPLLVDRVFDDDAESVLTEIADYADALWEVQWDSSTDQITVVWTQPSERTSDVSDPVIDYEVDKSTASQETKVVIKGASTPVDGEQFTADHGAGQGLTTQTILTGSEAVRDPDTGDQFERGDDYQMSYDSPGSITTLSSGSMVDGDTYEVSYQQQPEGEFAADAHDGGPPLVRTIPSATSNRECRQAAVYLTDRLEDPLITASVTLSRLDAGVSLVDDVAIDALPDALDRAEVQSVTQTPQTATLQLGNRAPLEELLNDYGTRLGAAEKRL